MKCIQPNCKKIAKPKKYGRMVCGYHRNWSDLSLGVSSITHTFKMEEYQKSNNIPLSFATGSIDTIDKARKCIGIPVKRETSKGVITKVDNNGQCTVRSSTGNKIISFYELEVDIETIAREIGFLTLEEQGRDPLDFKEVHVSGLKEALGKASGNTLSDEDVNALAKEYFDIDTLDTRNSDSLDFHEVAVWDIAEALEVAASSID